MGKPEMKQICKSTLCKGFEIQKSMCANKATLYLEPQIQDLVQL